MCPFVELPSNLGWSVTHPCSSTSIYLSRPLQPRGPHVRTSVQISGQHFPQRPVRLPDAVAALAAGDRDPGRRGRCSSGTCAATTACSAARARWPSGCSKPCLIALILFLLWHPALSVATLRPQQNVVAVLVDDSRSMSIERCLRHARGGRQGAARRRPAEGARREIPGAALQVRQGAGAHSEDRSAHRRRAGVAHRRHARAGAGRIVLAAAGRDRAVERRRG